MLETTLFAPIQSYLEARGYEVQAEVKDCDIVAKKGDELIIIELKTSANLSLLVQATARQKISDSVYIAIPKPKSSRKKWLGVQRVVKKLELGLLVVEQGALGYKVIKLFDPKTSTSQQKRKNPRLRSAVLTELAERSANYNIGGSTGIKLMTAYKETAIYIACCLNTLGECTPKSLRALDSGLKTTGILSNNHYGWFTRVSRGIYKVTERGRAESAEFKEIYKLSSSKLQIQLKAN